MYLLCFSKTSLTAVLCDILVFQRIPAQEHYGSDFVYEVIESPLSADNWAVVETLPSEKSSSSYTLRTDSVQLAVIAKNEIGSALPSTVFRISSVDLC